VSRATVRRSGSGSRRRGAARALLLGALLALVVVAAGCGADSPDIFRPGGSAGEEIKTLSFQIFAILAVVLVTVWGLLTFVIIKYRRRPESEVSKTRGNLKIEIVWTLIPAIIVTTARPANAKNVRVRDDSLTQANGCAGIAATSPSR